MINRHLLYRLPLVLVSVLLLSSCDSGDGSDDRPAILGTGDESIFWDGATRRYQVHVSSSYDSTTPTPILLAFHGQGSNSKDMQQALELDELADREGFIVAYLDDLTEDWAEGCGCAEADNLNVDDPGFSLAVVDMLSGTYNIDDARVFALGFSIGGLFVQRLACEYADEFAGVIAVASTMSTPLSQTCAPSEPVDVTVVLGTDDSAFPWNGSTNGIFSLLSVDAMTDEWLANNSCAQTPERTDGQLSNFDLISLRYSQCESGGSFNLHSIEGGRHFWYPGTEALVYSAMSGSVADVRASE